MKLFSQYNRINLTVMAVLFVLSGFAYFFIIHRILIHELDEELDNYKQKIEAYALQNNNLPQPGVLEDLTVKYELTEKPSSDVKYSLARRYDSGEHRKENFRELKYTQPVGQRFYTVSIAKPLEGIRLLTKTLVYSTVTLLLIIIFSSLLLNHIVLKRLWRPFYDSIKALKGFRISRDKPIQFPATPIEEFSFMNENLSRTMNAAQTDYRLLKEFTENASHEVQTPLAIIRTKLDLLIQDENLSENHVGLLNSVYSAIKRISRLNQSLLLLTKIENQQYADTEKINLETEITDKIEQFRQFWENNHIRISATLEDSYVNINPNLLDVLLNNLLGNAGVHNREGGEVFIRLKAGQLVISNTGPSRELDSERLFRRFYKEEVNSSHNGLGLSIIKQICDQSGISIGYSFKDSFHSFTLTWPIPTN